MQSEHAHLNLNTSVPYIPHVSLEHHIKEVALKSMEKIPGAKEIIEAEFNKKAWDMPFKLPGKRYYNQVMHLGF